MGPLTVSLRVFFEFYDLHGSRPLTVYLDPKSMQINSCFVGVGVWV